MLTDKLTAAVRAKVLDDLGACVASNSQLLSSAHGSVKRTELKPASVGCGGHLEPADSRSDSFLASQQQVKTRVWFREVQM